MRICLLGEFDSELDEAMRKTASYLYEYLSRDHNVLKADLRNIFSIKFWRDIREFNPSVIHYVSGSSLLSFALLKIISIYSNSKSVISIMRPTFSNISLKLVRLFKPDVLIVQSPQTWKKLRDINVETIFMPVIGVDTNKFNPSLRKKRIPLRKKFNLDPGDFLVLHVGSLKEGRNLRWLSELQNIDGLQVLIVGAVSQGSDEDLCKELKDNGCIIWDKYFENIEEIYAVADCYVFPVIHRENIVGKSEADCIDMPLSVIEAMACNIPVVSTKFGGLDRILEGGGGLLFVETLSEFKESVKSIKNLDLDFNNFDKVKNYSWSETAKRLSNVYKKT